MEPAERQPVLILGAGINGCAVARELALNGVDVWVVDLHDVAFGATSRSSRLIHGGLRYLEYGDFRLVRESLRERARLRRLAPQFVEPLTLYIPASRRGGGLIRSLFRFLGISRSRMFWWLAAPFEGGGERGLWLIRMGLGLYDRLARDTQFSRPAVRSVSEPGVPPVDAARYRWLCSYTDGQMRYPERFTLALLEDARQLARSQGSDFRVLTYHRVALKGNAAEIRRCEDEAVIAELRPPVIVNATGAWGDLTLGRLHVPSRRLFGGTKGSHIVSHHPALRAALGGAGIYAEANDGRLIFVLPFGESVLIGTTDERFEDQPERAVATDDELRYLLEMVNDLCPGVSLTEADVDLHYSGVRPLPYAVGSDPGAVSRDHWIETHQDGHPPVLTLIGGKLTTARSFAETVADQVLKRLDVPRCGDTRSRPVPGGDHYPPDAAALDRERNRLAERFRLRREQVQAVWSLCGNRVEQIFGDIGEMSVASLPGTELPIAFARWVIENEWVTTLDDLAERRLMLLFQPGLSRDCLEQLAGCLVEAGRLDPKQSSAAVQATIDRLSACFGKRVS